MSFLSSRWILLSMLSMFSVLSLIAVSSAEGQSGEEVATPEDELVNPVYAAQNPFRPGEVHRFQAHFGVIRAGRASLEVSGPERVRGHDALRFDMSIQGGIPGARIRNQVTSWAYGSPLRTLRFVQDLNEVGSERYRSYEIYPDRGISILEHENDEEEEFSTNLPLDDISFIYFARTLPLEVGDRYVLPRYFRDSGNPVILEVLRVETISVPAGRYETIVVQPTFRSRGLFGEGAEAEVHFSNDYSRIVVQVRSRISRLGSLTLRLTEDPRRVGS